MAPSCDGINTPSSTALDPPAICDLQPATCCPPCSGDPLGMPMHASLVQTPTFFAGTGFPSLGRECVYVCVCVCVCVRFSNSPHFRNAYLLQQLGHEARLPRPVYSVSLTNARAGYLSRDGEALPALTEAVCFVFRCACPGTDAPSLVAESERRAREPLLTQSHRLRFHRLTHRGQQRWL
ncbi:hypothetical protein K431DRAFT_59398 [Polychaeton citri CBS 116435]|uniref:Uncharacterized protein n=1 Tax=Polychaeton citri CBS 116435 TaxID=1314669 RepID=A0A9P4Q7I5_9PEZI|nr:hypothetical protein K431DRAFT_59398 [Polychaeton citri CBS 116435]